MSGVFPNRGVPSKAHGNCKKAFRVSRQAPDYFFICTRFKKGWTKASCLWSQVRSRLKSRANRNKKTST